MPNDTAIPEPKVVPQIGYCTNVHAGADLLATRANLEKYALAVKRQVSDGAPMGIGLWLSAEAARQLLAHELVEPFSQWLTEVGLVPFTLNGFPYGDFHETVVKHDVYKPDWTEDSRLQYTESLIEIQDQLLAPGMPGSISTLPLLWANPPPSDQQMARCAKNLRLIAARLERLEQERGRLITVCLEPEPGCVLQRSADVVHFFEECLLANGVEDRLRRYIRVCHDVCHAAVMFEEQPDVLRRYESAGIQIGKVQISSAVVLPLDKIPPDQRAAALAQLGDFAEDRYLHQTMVQTTIGKPPDFYEDLPQALRSVGDPALRSGQWRVHYHVPIYLQRFGLLETSREEILACLTEIHRMGGVDHLEVETYAWELLPVELRHAELADGIAEELRWLHEHLQPTTPRLS